MTTVPLPDAARVATPDASATPRGLVSPAGDLHPWQAVWRGCIAHGRPVRGRSEWPVYARYTSGASGRPAGTLWHDRGAGEWRAYRVGFGTPVQPYETRGEALAAVGWLDTVSATLSRYRDGRIAGLEHDGMPRVVLPDGAVVDVLDASDVYAAQHQRPAPGVYGPSYVRVVALTVAPTPHRMELPTPPGRLRGGEVLDVARPDDQAAPYTLTMRAHAHLALVPPCAACGVYAGEACASNCLSDATD